MICYRGWHSSHQRVADGDHSRRPVNARAIVGAMRGPAFNTTRPSGPVLFRSLPSKLGGGENHRNDFQSLGLRGAKRLSCRSPVERRRLPMSSAGGSGAGPSSEAAAGIGLSCPPTSDTTAGRNSPPARGGSSSTANENSRGQQEQAAAPAQEHAFPGWYVSPGPSPRRAKS